LVLAGDNPNCVTIVVELGRKGHAGFCNQQINVLNSPREQLSVLPQHGQRTLSSFDAKDLQHEVPVPAA
jgi:hypothetical protein